MSQAVSAKTNPTSLRERPLCVDLDGTISHKDTFYQSLAKLLRRNPLFLFVLPFWVLRGKAFTKKMVSDKAPLTGSELAYNHRVLTYLKRAKENKRTIYLVTGADRHIAELVATELGLFDGVFSSDGTTNLTRERKAVFLEQQFGISQFDYIGNDDADLPVWRLAHTAHVANNDPSFVDVVRRIAPVEEVFPVTQETSLKDYIDIARPDHWFKNIFILPGMLIAWFFFPIEPSLSLLGDILISVFATCLVASSNYVINEILDAERDRHHPVKKLRPLAAGRVSIPIAYGEWILLGALGIALGLAVNWGVGAACISLWVMGTLYNVPPMRTKEVPYLDVLSEAVNNPIRMTVGWYAITTSALPPVSALFAYWMFGAFLMGTKRFAEYRRIGDPERAAAYRWSFKYYNEERLIVSSVFYIAMFMTGAMAFVMLYRLELVFAMPFVAYLLAYYLYLGFRPNSPVQYPELLYKERHLMLTVGACALFCAVLFFIDIPEFRALFTLITPES